MRLLFTFFLFFVPLFSMAQSIYPTPQNVSITNNSSISLQNGVKLVDKNADKEAVSLLEMLLPINDKGKISLIIGEDAVNVPKGVVIPNVSGAYYLRVSPKEIIIKGYDKRGTFYGVQTLRQLLECSSLL